MMSTTLRRLTATLGLLAGMAATAGAEAAPRPDGPVLAPESLRYCAVCHGVELMGNFAVDAPKLAGLPAWYVTRQLEAFRNGWRGAHADDATGMEMRPQAAVLEPDQLQAAVRYVESVPARHVPVTVSGDLKRGQAQYQACAVCHGAAAEGNAALNAPPLAGQSDWYLRRQLEHFRSGARGANPGDTQGALMRASVTTLADDQAIDDVVAYITSLQQPH
ncbi:MAG: c-type cytochrome [Pseudomonadales bacterium]